MGRTCLHGIPKATNNPKQALTNHPMLLKASKPAITVNLRFPGQYADEESGLFYNHFRSYRPGVGSYTQADPIGLEGGWNRTGYVGGDTLSGIDPRGLVECSCVATSTSGVGYTADKRKICQYSCKPKNMGTPIVVNGGSRKGRDGDNCYGVELQTQPTQWGELVDVPVGINPFVIDTDSLIDKYIRYDTNLTSEILKKMKK